VLTALLVAVGDDLADLFVVNFGNHEHTNQFFLGNNAAENGWFTEVTDSELSQTVGCASYLCASLALDADADGNMDLLVTGHHVVTSCVNMDCHTIGAQYHAGIYYGDGAGRFPASVSLGTISVPVDAAAGDFNEVFSIMHWYPV
jgi:hypothetical protein